MPASAAAPSGETLVRWRAPARRSRSRPKHLDIGHQVVAEGDGLGDLHMGEARHDRVRMLAGALDQGLLQVADGAVERIDRVAHPESKHR